MGCVRIVGIRYDTFSLLQNVGASPTLFLLARLRAGRFDTGYSSHGKEEIGPQAYGREARMEAGSNQSAGGFPEEGRPATMACEFPDHGL